MDKRSHKERYDAGLKTRREVLGAPYVDKAMQGVDEFNREFVEMLNTYCWNDIWNRPGLPRKTRSVLNLGMLCALGKEHAGTPALGFSMNVNLPTDPGVGTAELALAVTTELPPKKLGKPGKRTECILVASLPPVVSAP